jgi:hypothetical protein
MQTMTPEQEKNRSEMPMFRMTDPATGTTGLLKVKKDSNGRWTIPNPELRKKFHEQMLKSLEYPPTEG